VYDRPVAIASGYASWTARFDGRGNRVEVAYRDEAGRLVFSRKDGCARTEDDYDERGNCVRTAYFDPQGKPVVGKDGYAGWTARYDERGNRIAQSFFNAEGKRPAAWPHERWKFDDRGNAIEIAYLDEKGHPVLNRDKLAVMKVEHDERGNPIARAYFDDRGRPTEDWARESLKYDERGNIIDQVFLAADGKPVRTSKGYAGCTYCYDGRGNCIGRTFFDQDRKPLRTRPVIVEVAEGTQGAQLKLQAGDVIESIGGKTAESRWLFLFTRSLESNDAPPKEMVIFRKGRRLTFAVKPGLLGVTLQDRILPAPDATTELPATH
jgi:hypothetical protein